ncbi:hypothetical protein ACJDU8_00950 [Clostridium sp. WILCCON 0269]|uniref:Uncharacterized protein n=1 Tax=Candidatus Clostridium eludens TaxID=3381663 RepID=A0ABW8SEM2_9CLOT
MSYFFLYCTIAHLIVHSRTSYLPLSFTGHFKYSPYSQDYSVNNLPSSFSSDGVSGGVTSIPLDSSEVVSTNDFFNKGVDSSGNIATIYSATGAVSDTITATPISTTETTDDGTNTVAQTVQNAVNTIASKLGGTVS